MNQFGGYVWMAVLGALGLALAGAVLYQWLARRAVRIGHALLANWPLAARPLVNTEEGQVWRWLCKTFPEHQVNLKIPLTRFTRPLERKHAENLYQQLNGVYCSFTVCTPDGRVVGCADVMGVNGPASNNRQLKQDLLAKFGIAYYVLRPVSLPAAAAIRRDFLGATLPLEPSFQYESTAERRHDAEESQLAEARLKLSDALTRQRRIRDSDLSPLFPNSPSSKSDSVHPAWQHNSFLVPLCPLPGK